VLSSDGLPVHERDIRLLVSSDPTPGGDQRMIVEVSQFRLALGTDERAFIVAAERSQSGFLGQQAGFIGRDLLRAEDGSWMDVVRFETIEAARAAFEAFAGHPAAKAFESMLDPSAVTMSHWSVAKSW
jgi:hypothetical protein